MKRLLLAALIIPLTPPVWGQAQTGAGVPAKAAPGIGWNAGASSLRLDVPGSNSLAPASFGLGRSALAPLPLSPRVSVSAQAAAVVPVQSPARLEFRAVAAQARTAREIAAAAPSGELTVEETAPEKRADPAVLLRRLAVSPLRDRQAFDGEAAHSGTDSHGSSRQPPAGLSHEPSLRKPGGPGVENEKEEPPAPSDAEPFKLQLWKRALAVTAVLGFLGAAPSLLNAAALETVGRAVTPALTGNAFSLFLQNAGVLAGPWAWGAAAALAFIGLPLRIWVYRLSPWSMHWRKDPGNGLAKKSLWLLLPLLAVAAASEELVFRAVAFGLAFVFLAAMMPAPLALAAASFLSSLLFALIHGYGSVWTRVVGGMLYCAAFAVTGSLLFVILTHMLFNLLALGRERAKTSAGRLNLVE